MILHCRRISILSFIGQEDYHLLFDVRKTGLGFYHRLHLYFTNANNIGNTENTNNEMSMASNSFT